MSRNRRGQGTVYRPKYTYKGERRTSQVWWIQYYGEQDGKAKKFRESSGSKVKSEAVALLNKRLGESKRQRAARQKMRDVVFGDLVQLLRDNYELKGNKSNIEPRIKHLQAAFDGQKVAGIREGSIDRYAADRVRAGAANATVNRELAALRRMFNLAERAKLVDSVPGFEMLPENNVRKGFFEEDDLQRLLRYLPVRLHALARVAFITGWRRGELLSRDWQHVNFDSEWLRLEPGETKNGEGRNFPIIAPLRRVLEEQKERKLEVEKRTGRIIAPLFFYLEGPKAGQRIKSFRRAWATACRKAGIPDRRMHDFRRTAVRGLTRAGVPRSAAKKLTGHETDSIFERYNIADEAVLIDAGQRYEAHLNNTSSGPAKRAVG